MTAEWVAKAEGDFAMMERECQATENPNYDGICFHAQQCAEKYLKARREDLAYLSDFAVTFRYPGESADAESAIDAQRRCRRFRNAARETLGLEK